MTLTRRRIKAIIISIALLIMLDVPPTGVSLCERKRIFHVIR